MAWVLGSLTFPSGQEPSDGEYQRATPQEWAKIKPIGASAPGTKLRYISSPSPEHNLVAIISDATATSLLAIFNARAVVAFTSPYESYDVVMTECSIVKNRALRGVNRWQARFTLVKAE